MGRRYDIKTRLGTVTIIADSIKDARRRAKLGWGLGPRAVSTSLPIRRELCGACDSTPCVCRG